MRACLIRPNPRTQFFAFSSTSGPRHHLERVEQGRDLDHLPQKQDPVEVQIQNRSKRRAGQPSKL